MYCKHCGAELREGAKFCGKCGTAIVAQGSEPKQPLISQETVKEKKELLKDQAVSVKERAEDAKVTLMEKKEELADKVKSTEAGAKVVSMVDNANASAEAGSPNATFYVIDFFKKMFRVKNTGVLIYLFLNLIIIFAVFFALMGGQGEYFLPALGAAIAIYGFSLAVALSPVGEWILRVQAGGRKIKRQEQLDFLMPIFEEVYAKAKAEDPTLPNDIKLYIADDDAPNAFATGRKTVCVTRGLLELKREKIAGTLAHEFGHLAHHDTDLLLLVNVGNFVVTVIVLGVRLAIHLAELVADIFAIFLGGREGAIGILLHGAMRVLADVTVGILVWLWTKLGTLLVMRSSRNNEFEADKFACDLGYGAELCATLDTIGGEGAKGLFAALASTHPATDDRIARMQSYGVNYTAAGIYGQI